jgi:hypothetical protein
MERSASSLSPSPPTGETWDGPIPVRSSLHVNHGRREEGGGFDDWGGAHLPSKLDEEGATRDHPLATGGAVQGVRISALTLPTCETGRERGILIPVRREGPRALRWL